MLLNVTGNFVNTSV